MFDRCSAETAGGWVPANLLRLSRCRDTQCYSVERGRLPGLTWSAGDSYGVSFYPVLSSRLFVDQQSGEPPFFVSMDKWLELVYTVYIYIPNGSIPHFILPMYIDQPRVPFWWVTSPKHTKKKNFSFHDIFGCFITMICHASHNSAKLFHISHEQIWFQDITGPTPSGRRECMA